MYLTVATFEKKNKLLCNKMNLQNIFTNCTVFSVLDVG